MKIRVLSVDDHRIVRDGLALIIDREPDMELVASTATGEDAIELVAAMRPHIVLMDLQLRTMSGHDAIEAVRRQDPSVKVIVLTMYEGDEDIFRALEVGATTYLFKDTISDDLIRVIRQVYNGERPLPQQVKIKLADRARQPTLTSRELQVMQLIAGGKRNKAIAASLRISEETVHVHLKNIFAKLSVTDRASALNVAMKRGIVHI
jgi:DNA-binding NarL/FixJ family response regulator